MKENFTPDSASNFFCGAWMGNDNGYHPVHFRKKCQAYSGCFIFVVTGSLPKLFIRFRQKNVIHDSSAIALLKTALPGIP